MASLRASWWVLALTSILLSGMGCGSKTSGSGGNASGSGTTGSGMTSGTGGSGPSGSAGSGMCSDGCMSGAERCAGAKVQQCQKQATGCLDWSAPGDCPTNNTCIGNQCVLACADKCVDASTQCNAGQIQTCAKQANGCTDFGAATACPGGGTCSGGMCASMCTDQCTAGATQCSGPQVQTCAKQANGCTDYGPAQACPTSETCSGTMCAATCTDKCPAGATQCAGAQQQTCAKQANGCTDWGAAQNCPAAQSCSAGQCAPTACAAGTLRCNGTLLEVCNAAQKWQTQQVCAQSCDMATTACTETATCTSASRRCTGNEIEVCNSTGTAWLGVQSCAVGCAAGLCTGACTPGATRCNAMTPETCNMAGNAWTPAAACATFCVAGGCADPALTIDANANAVLNGEHWFNGDVVIKNSSVLTVSTGKLIIHAKNVILDASSQIVVAPTGNDPRGTGGASSTTCNAGDCISNNAAPSPAAGGSYGTAGTGANGTTSQGYCYYANGGYYEYCFSTTSSPSPYLTNDDEAAAGAAGGACSGGSAGLGGGLLVIYADNIQLLGAVTANGQSGTGCAGGGSGGGVVLRANADLTFTGSISVAPGAGGSSGGGGGGNGVVKLLYGNTRTLTGAVVGQKLQSFMPPYDVSSTSHPDATRWYNDGFTVFELAWSKPFSTSAGYYDKLNTTYGYVPTPANSLFLATEAQLYPPSALVAGTNDFHVDTLGPFANVGTIEHRYTVNVNTTPPTIASSSHPDPSTWYNNTSPYLTWTVPHADADVVSFYWVFDPYASTVPGKTANVIPMDLSNPQNSKQLLLPNQMPGIWFLHVITEDTMGYLTKAAGSFRVQIGADPGQGSVSGSVTDAMTSAFLSGVTVTLNRGVQTTSTNASGGYAFPNTVYAQQYEIRASMMGYKDTVKTVTVMPGQTATVNFAMSP